MTDKIIGWVKSKTVWGTLVLAASFIPQLVAYSPFLHTIGTTLAGVGLADKLDRIHKVLTEDSPS